MTFDIQSHVYRYQQHRWQNWHEVFSVCRACDKPTIFLIALSLRGREKNHDGSDALTRSPESIMNIKDALNRFFSVERYISLRDNVSISPPEYLPQNIEDIFKEGAACYSIGCYNAAGTMFRLCLDYASTPLLPNSGDEAVAQPSKQQRRVLGLRMEWLFDNGLLSLELKELAKCVREDGNDGAHAGNLSKNDVDDLIDFTVTFLERLITEPKKLELAEARRERRRNP